MKSSQPYVSTPCADTYFQKYPTTGKGKTTMRSVSLNTKLLSICTGSLIIMFLACLYSFLQTVESEEAKIRDNWYQNVHQMEPKLGSQFVDRYGDVQAWALNSVMQTRNIQEITKALNAYINIYAVYDLIMVVDMSGQVIATSSVDPKNNPLDPLALAEISRINHAQAPWFTHVVQERFTEDSGKGFTGTFVEDIMIDALTTTAYRKKQIGMSFSAPIRDENGKMIAVMTSRSSLRWIEDRFVDLYEDLKKEGLTTAELILLNKKGEMVVHYEPSTQNASDAVIHDFENTLFKVNLLTLGHAATLAASRGEEGTSVAQHIRRGTMQMNAYAPLRDKRFIDELGWILLFRIQDEALLGRVILAKQKFFVISGLVLALCLLVSGFFYIRLSRRLRQISENIARSGNTVDNVSTQLSAASQDLSSGATQVASSLQETVSSLEELTSMVRANAENAGEAASLAQNSSRIAKDGESEVQNLIGAISEIDHSSKKIEEIITVIDDIAFQTNLLALNAAVEAARAGEQGKGFAVVAEAVRNLAQRSGTAAKEITGLIRDNVDKIDRGTRIADRSGQVLQSILASVRKVADLNNEIAAASKEQSSGLSQISKAMNEIDQATQRNAAASEEVASSSEEMNAQATTLQSMVHDLSDVITGSRAGDTMPPPSPVPATAARHRRTGNVMELKRPPVRPASRTAAPAQTAMKAKSHAESVIPFGDEGDDEPPARISSTAGF
jgi:hypothetical protein